MFGYELLFVHGAWEGPWAFSPWSAYLAEGGWAVRSLTLPGHGSGDEAGRYGLGDYLEALEEGVWDPGRTVLVGHSLGGWLILKYLEEHQVAASVLLAPVPAEGLPPRTQRALFELAPWDTAACLLLGRPPVLTRRELVRRTTFLPDTPEEVVQRFMERCVAESPRVIRALSLMRWAPLASHRIRRRRLRALQEGRPHLLLAAERDFFFLPGELASTAALLGAETWMLKGSPHGFPVLDEDRAIVGGMEAWLRRCLAPEAKGSASP
ncbi:MAG: alpha/beta hydrolase [Acidobacteriota bacterium]